MFVVRSRAVSLLMAGLVAGGAGLMAACGGSEPTGTGNDSPSNLTIVSGNGQVGLLGTALAAPLVVKVTGSSGAPLAGVSVQFTVSSGTATVTPGTASTDATGQAKATVTLGSSAGTDTIVASVGSNLSQHFVVTAGTTAQTLACSSTSPQTPAAGAVLPGVSGTGICLGAAAGGSDYAVVVFNGNPNQAVLGQVNVAAHGATALSTPDLTPLTDVFRTPQHGSPLVVGASGAQEQFDMRLRRIARTQLAPLVPAARAAMRSGARRNVIPTSLTLNQVITINARGDSACSSPINIGARVAAISNTAYVLADTANPPGGFSDADYASFAAQFDTLINPLDVNTFGAPTDIDHNGKILMIFTKEVNRLTPRGANGVVGGFFFDRDLFPTTTQNGLEGCPTSNFGEMFYMLVPDPNAVFSDKRALSDVTALTPGTLAHEYQHLINAGRRLYVNTTSDYPEVSWLNEGLSHIAEELLFYKVTGLAPRQNIDLAAARTVASQFGQYQGSNFGRYDELLAAPAQTSPYAGSDDVSLATRGAIWNLLRYLADHKGSSDGSTWSSLVNTPDTGQKNLATVFGPDWLTQIRDWATSVFSDDVPGNTDARFLEQSWNMRSIFPGLQNGSGGALNKFPLNVTPLADAQPANLLINAGGVAYLRFTVPAGGQASIDWTTAAGLPVSPFFQFTVVRTR
jgi:hypothetical protein